MITYNYSETKNHVNKKKDWLYNIYETKYHVDIKTVIKYIIFSKQNSGHNKYVYYIKFITKCAKRLENLVLQ